MISVTNYRTEEGRRAVEAMLSRSQLETGNVQEIVDGILADVKANGDKAVFQYTEKFDGVALTKETLKVTQAEIDAAYGAVSPELVAVIQ